jgi:PAS domain S-box-containing protein
MAFMPTQAVSPVSRRKLFEWVLLVAALALVGVFFAFVLTKEADRVHDTERDRLNVLKNVIANDIQANLVATNRALEGVIKDYLSEPGVVNASHDVSRRLQVLADTMLGIRGTVVLDANGFATAANRNELIGQDFSQRDYFKTVRDKPDKTTLYVSAPFKSIQDDLVVTMSRMVPGPQGEFAGVVVATLDPEYFISIFRSIVYAPDVWAFVDHSDGLKLMNFPEKPGINGLDLNKQSTFFSRHLQSGQIDSLLTGMVYATGEQRLIALRTIQPAILAMDKALVVGISRTLAAISQPLRRQAITYALFFAALVGLCCAALYWSQMRRSQIEAWNADRERERREGDERLQAAQRMAGIGAWAWDIVSDTHTWSQEVFLIYGRDPALAPAVYPEVQQYFTPRSWTLLAAAVENLRSTGAPFEVDAEVVRPDGSRRWIAARGDAKRDGDGKIDRLLGTVQDITERKLAEATLRESKDLLQSVVENMPVRVFWKDRDSRFLGCNTLFAKDAGCARPEEVTGKTDSEMLWKGQAEVYRSDDQAVMASGSAKVDIEEPQTNSDGTVIWLRTSKVPLRDESNQVIGILGLYQDITEKKRHGIELEGHRHHLEELVQNRTLDLAAARDAAEAANRSKAEFLAKMSHEIRSPLNAILGLAYLLEQAHLDHDALDMVGKIRASGRSLLGIINDILDVSKIDAGHMEIEQAPFRLGDVIDNLAGTMGIAAGNKNIELIIQPPPPGISTVVGDALRVGQVLINLTSNAIKFTQAGRVEVRCELLSRHEEKIMLRFRVLDTGIGIAPELQSDVFSAFTQADSSTTRRFGGTGLGLTISRQLVELMGGEIGLTSTPEQGSEFWFTVPLQQVANTDFSSPYMVRIDVLIADDSDIALNAVSAIAQGLGWQVSAVDSGEAVLAHMKQRKGGKLPSVVVLDWKMPGMDGLATACAIREGVTKEECPIVIMATAYSLTSLASQPGAELVDAILNKPVTTSNLYNAVLEAQRRRAAHVGIPQALLQTTSDGLAGVRVLVVDDSDINREVAQRILREQGAIVTLADDGQAALDWLIAHPNEVDLVLMDVQMPVMDGIEATRQLRRLPQFNDLPIVALTAGAFKSQQVAAHAAGMTDFISKPFDVPATIALIQRLRRQSNPPHTEAQALTGSTPIAPAVVASSAAMSVLDVAHGLKIWSNVRAYQDYLRRFVVSYGNAVDVINASLAAADLAAAAALAHKLSGVAANLALPDTQRLAVEAERVLTTGYDPTLVLARLRRALGQVVAAIARFAPLAIADDAPGAAELVAGERSPQAQTGLKTQLIDLLAALDTDNPSAAQILLAELEKQLPPPALAGIAECVRGFDFRGAEAGTVKLAREHDITLKD